MDNRLLAEQAIMRGSTHSISFKVICKLFLECIKPPHSSTNLEVMEEEERYHIVIALIVVVVVVAKPHHTTVVVPRTLRLLPKPHLSLVLATRTTRHPRVRRHLIIMAPHPSRPQEDLLPVLELATRTPRHLRVRHHLIMAPPHPSHPQEDLVPVSQLQRLVVMEAPLSPHLDPATRVISLLLVLPHQVAALTLLPRQGHRQVSPRLSQISLQLHRRSPAPGLSIHLRKVTRPHNTIMAAARLVEGGDMSLCLQQLFFLRYIYLSSTSVNDIQENLPE